MGQNRFLKFALLLLAGLSAWGGSAWAGETETRAFRAFRKGDDIGHHRVSVTRDGAETRVKVDISLIVRLAGFLPVYHYHHQSEELWRDNRLVRLVSNTDDDGEQQYLKAEAAPDGKLKVDGSKYRGLAPADIMPTSYWNSSFPNRVLLLDTQNGRLLKVQVAPLPSKPEDGVPPGSRRYQLDGDLRLEIWYDPQQRWAKTRFGASDGSVIDYRLQE